MLKIKIKPSSVADTRTCDWSKVTKEELLAATQSHIADVKKGMEFFASIMYQKGLLHDYTKTSHIDDFYNDFKNGFKTQEWYKMHQEKERHHLKDEKYIQSDVNLLDIIEMIVDCVMAGMARSGEYRQEDIPDSLLRKAFNNTVKMLLDNVEVEK